MPSYRVKAPDGRTFTVNAPEGATQDQVLAFARKHMPAPPSRGGTGALGAVNGFLSAGNEMAIGAVEGLYNEASAITDPIIHKISSLISGKDVADASLASARHSRRGVSDAVSRTVVSNPNPVAREIGRVGAAIAAPAPKIGLLEKAGTMGRVVQRAYQGAIGGAAVRDVDEDPTNAEVTGAAANVVLPPILARVIQSRPAQAVARAVGRYGAPVMSSIDEGVDAVLSRFGSEPASRAAAPVTRSAAMTHPLEPLGKKAVARAARFKAVGVDEPTTGMVTRDPNAYSFERNTAKVEGVGDDLQQQIANVEASLTAKGQELVRTAGGAKGPEATGKAVQDALDSKRSEMQKVTGKLYEQVREARGEQPVGRLDTLREKMSDPDVVDNAAFDQMREGLVRRMTRLGLVGKDGSLSQPVNISQAEELRKFIGSLGSTTEPGVRMMRGRLIEALDDDVVDTVGDDAFKAARASAKARFEEFGKTFASKIADQGIAPEALTKRVLSDTMRLSDLRAMRESLHTGTDEQIARGKEAWQSLRGQALEDFLSGATDANGQFMGAKLAKDFAKQAPKFRELLDPADYKMLHRLVNATRDAKVAPAQSSVNHSNTAPTLANMFQQMNPATRRGWKRLLVRSGAHTAAFATTGPMGNLALFTGSAIIKDVGEAKAANALLDRVRLAKSPQETAKAIKALRDAAKANPAIAKLIQERPVAGAVAGTQAE